MWNEAVTSGNTRTSLEYQIAFQICEDPRKVYEDEQPVITIDAVAIVDNDTDTIDIAPLPDFVDGDVVDGDTNADANDGTTFIFGDPDTAVDGDTVDNNDGSTSIFGDTDTDTIADADNNTIDSNPAD